MSACTTTTPAPAYSWGDRGRGRGLTYPHHLWTCFVAAGFSPLTGPSPLLTWLRKIKKIVLPGQPVLPTGFTQETQREIERSYRGFSCGWSERAAGTAVQGTGALLALWPC